MRHRLQHAFSITLACYTAAWLCVAPSLVLCICDHGQGAGHGHVVSRTHETPACDGHGHDHGHGHAPSDTTNQLAHSADLDPATDTHSDPIHEHSDRPIVDDNARVDQSTQLALDLPVATELFWLTAHDPQQLALPMSDRANHHGPPTVIDLSLRSIILLT